MFLASENEVVKILLDKLTAAMRKKGKSMKGSVVTLKARCVREKPL